MKHPEMHDGVEVAGVYDHEHYEEFFEGLLRVLLVIIAAALVFNLVAADTDPLRLIFTAASGLTTLVSWLILRSGRRLLAANVLIVGYWFIVSLLLIATGGLFSPWLLSQFSIVLLGGLLVGKQASNALTFLSLIFQLGLYLFQANGNIGFVSNEFALQEKYFSTSINFLMVALVVYLGRDLVLRSINESRSSAKLYRSLFDKTNDAVFIIDTDQKYIDANQQAVDLLGYSHDELVGMTVSQVVVPEERNDSLKRIGGLDEKEMLPVYERNVVCKDGSRKTVEVNLARVLDEQGKPLYYQSIVRDVSERKLLEQQIQNSLDDMEEIAMKDSLTALLNRRAIMEHAEAEWHRAKREGQPMCLMLVDVDNLKDINDHQGHLSGDEALIKLAEAISNSKRRYDWAGRWGGDEFLVVLPNTSLSQAKEVAERVRTLAKGEEVAGESGGSITVEVSSGVACFSARPGDEVDLNQLLSLTDKALYDAKESGRNRVSVYRD